MSTQAPNHTVRNAATAQNLLNNDDITRMVNGHRRHQVTPHAIAATLLLLGVSAAQVAAYLDLHTLVTAATAMLSYGAALATGALMGKRGRVMTRRERLAVLAAATWLTLASLGINGPLIFLLLMLSGAVGLKHWRDRRRPAVIPTPVIPAPTALPTSELDKYEGRWIRKVATNGSKGISGAELVGGVADEIGMTWTVELINGETLSGVQARIGSIASLLGISAKNLQFDARPCEQGEMDDDSRIRMQIITSSPVINAVPYRVPVITDGRIPIGPYADGRTIASIPLVTRNSVRSIVVIGSSGSGKSSLINGLLISIRANFPTVTLTLDPKGNSSPDLRKNSTVAMVGLGEAEAFTRAVERLCEGRGYESALHGWSGYKPDAIKADGTRVTRPLYVVVIDECDMLFGLPGMGKRWGLIAKILRALGIPLILASQYAGIRVFGFDEVLRSNIPNVLLMRTDSNTSDKLIAPGLPPSRFLPAEPGYGYLKAEGARRASLRAAVVRSSDDAALDEEHAGILLARHGDVEVDAIGRVALGNLLEAPAEREATNLKSIETKLREFLSGKTIKPKATQDADGGGDLSSGFGKILRFPTFAEAFGPTTAAPALSPSEQRYLTILDAYVAGGGGVPGMREIERLSGWAETTARNYRDSLVTKGVLAKLSYGRYGRPGTPVAAESDDDESELADAEHASA